jgi:hypothetical protein
MADAKIEIKVGEVSFVGEGSETWLSTQLDKVMEHLPKLASISPPKPSHAGQPSGDTHAGAKATGTLAAFLTAKNAKANQVRKFLATAVWLHDSDKKTRLSTSDVSKALNDNNQGRLSNPADCLGKNITKGLCVKDGKQFYVTDEGRTDIG